MQYEDCVESLFFCCCYTPTQSSYRRSVSKNCCKFTSGNPSWLKRNVVFLSTGKKTFTRQLEDYPRASFRDPSMSSLELKDVMDFFRLRQGHWRSWRVTHHLAFRRDEQGLSNIFMKVLEKNDPRVVELCKAHQVDPFLAAGGCYVEWEAQMSWDQEGENHQGSTVFAIIPDDTDCCSGRLLRDRGYAEIVQVAGTFRLTPSKELVLHTPYDGGDVEESFSFIDKDMVVRSSTVKRFGGFATATFSTEHRQNVEMVKDSILFTEEMMPFGGPSMAPKRDERGGGPKWQPDSDGRGSRRRIGTMDSPNLKSTGALDFL